MLRLASLPPLIAALATLAALTAAGCSGSNVASQLAKAPEFEPEGQSKCGVHKSQARPLIVEWPSADRAALESQARRGRGLVAVRYEGCDMEVLPRCRAPGKYSYTGITRKRDRVTMRDSDELYANIPAYAAKFEGKLQTSGQLNVAMTIVGTYEADEAGVRADQLEGDCEGATHVIAGLTAGAFEFFAGADADASASAEGLGAKAGGRSTSQRETLNQDGEDAACARATSKDTEPPDGCGALLRVEVIPIAPAQAGAKAAPAATSAAAASSPSTTSAPAQASGPLTAPALGSLGGAPGGAVAAVASLAGGQGGCPAGMTLISGGQFKLSGRDATVGDYCLDLSEVTADAYKACVDAGKCSAEGLTCGPAATYGSKSKGNHPINCVDAAQAEAYCVAQGKRLPVEQEWEWAARGGASGLAYPWGNEEPAGQLCWGKAGTCAVGTNPRGDNPQGVHDLTGNVWEWTASPFGGKGGLRVIRGGSFEDTKAELVAAAKRVPNRPADRNPNLGFRCAKSP